MKLIKKEFICLFTKIKKKLLIIPDVCLSKLCDRVEILILASLQTGILLLSYAIDC